MVRGARVVTACGKWFVYALLDPVSGATHYIGITSDVSRRLREHLNESNAFGRNAKKRKWIAELRRRQMLPVCEVLESGVGMDNGDLAERRWISTAHSSGQPLFNITRGGNRGLARFARLPRRERMIQTMVRMTRDQHRKVSRAAKNAKESFSAYVRRVIRVNP